MTLIPNLTTEQAHRFHEFVDRWSDIGLSTMPLDHGLIEKRIRRVYQAAGYTEPARFMWFASPVKASIAYLALRQLEEAHGTQTMFGRSVKSSAAFPIVANVSTLKQVMSPGVFAVLTRDMADEVRSRVYDLVNAKIIERVTESLSSELYTDTWNATINVLDSLTSKINWDRVRQALSDSLPSLSSTVFRQGLGAEPPIEYRCLNDYLSLVCGIDSLMVGIDSSDKQPPVWWWPFEKTCMVAERYNKLHRDENLYLHNLKGPAIEYSDGWGLYAHHGVILDAWVIEQPDKLTPEVIVSERDPVVRGVLVKKYGEKLFSEVTGLQVLPLAKFPEWASQIDALQETKSVAFFWGNGVNEPLYMVRGLHNRTRQKP